MTGPDAFRLIQYARTELTTAQRTFLGALVANGYQPFGEALCLLLLGT